MTRHPAPRRVPYWTLVVFAGLLALPFGWAMGIVAAATVARVAWAARGPRTRARARAASGDLGRPTVSLGHDRRGRPVALSEAQLSAHALIVGASGAGKSTTMLRILGEQIAADRPVVAIDLKGSPAFARALEDAAHRSGRRLLIWTPDGPSDWNPLAHGNATELKDKLIGSERFTEPHYRRAAERYVQCALQVLLATGTAPQLNLVVALMDPRRLSALARRLDGPLGEHVQEYLGSLTPDQVSAVRGLGTRLALLSESQAGPFLGPAGASSAAASIDLRAALAGPDVVLFSLNSSRYGSLAAQLGTLAIQDLVSASGHRLEAGGRPGATAPPATVAVDEFSALGADHVLALLARGRESGISVLLATQELSDLERAGRGFRDQVLGLTAVKVAHRQDVPGSAQTIAEMAGTERVWEETRQLRSPFAPTGSRGTRRLVERFSVHPDEIKTLLPGQAVVLVKTPSAGVTRLRVTPGATRGGGDQEPGVTR